METIQAMVNPRLLTKASRLFTGTLQGRIIEILQNARRAGATKLEITNQDGQVTVRDNGQGIEDFARLLDLGGSAWEEAFERSEDPAGVGVFCLAPREVTIRSNGRMATIASGGWTGALVEVRDDPDPQSGTILQFKDEPWDMSVVEINAVFCGMSVMVDGDECTRLPFVSEHAAHHPELGCRVEVREYSDLDEWHRRAKGDRWYSANVLVNFHGQVVAVDGKPVSEQALQFLVDLTGEPTDIRLMLPARTQLVENEALETLRALIELEAYRHIQRRSHHRLPYKEYLRAKELGVDLPEAEPTYRVGLLTGDDPEPIEVFKPDEFPLSHCYRFDFDKAEQDTDEANIHLLAALGRFEGRFVPVDITKQYDGYSWADLPNVEKVSLRVGKLLQADAIWCGRLVCVNSLEITVTTSDGKTWTSPACMALRPVVNEPQQRWWDHEVLVTTVARERLSATDILYHLGGYSDEGDTWQTQEQQFSEELERFWDKLSGPEESLRRRVFGLFHTLDGWRSIALTPDGRMVITMQDGSERTVAPPAS